MKLIIGVNISIAAESASEAGQMQWLAERFKGQPIIIKFDTKEYLGDHYYPH